PAGEPAHGRQPQAEGLPLPLRPRDGRGTLRRRRHLADAAGGAAVALAWLPDQLIERRIILPISATCCSSAAICPRAYSSSMLLWPPCTSSSSLRYWASPSRSCSTASLRMSSTECLCVSSRLPMRSDG